MDSEWNDSLKGDFIWTNSNFCEAIADVMTPATRSMWDIYLEVIPFRFSDYPLVGVIGGRPYINLSLLASLGRAFGMDIRKMLDRSQDLWGRVPDGVEIPLLPLTKWQMLRMALPALVKSQKVLRANQAEIRYFTATCCTWCEEMRSRIRSSKAPAELAIIWREELRPYFKNAWRLVRAALDSDSIGELRRDLVDQVGSADANALLSNLGGSEHLASLGPLIGLSKIAGSAMTREEYLRHYGHRGPHEMELSFPRPAEDTAWLDQQIDWFLQMPVDVDALIEKQRAENLAAHMRFYQCCARKAKSIRERIDRAASSTRLREEVRSEATRVIWVVREFALRASELVGFENREDVFFLSLDEMVQVLSGNHAALSTIQARREIYARFSELPPYPAVIIGRFDPFQWAADPNRRSDLYDARGKSVIVSAKITGFAGAMGVVEGRVRRLDCPEDGEQLQSGEILVTATTNIGWTPLFPRAAAVVTDVGAPLSHAAIVARELGIPAVVGCGSATMCLHTGDWVRVNGGQGTVEILREKDK